MRIGELARECGLNPKTVRYYEAFGLLPRAARAPSGRRVYSEQDLRRLRFIRRAKQIGLPLASIRQITRYVDAGTCEHLRPRLRELIGAQLAEIGDRIKELRAVQRELQGRYASLCRPLARPPGAAACSCLDGPTRHNRHSPEVRPGQATPEERIQTRRRWGHGQAGRHESQAPATVGEQQVRLRLRADAREVRRS